MCKIIFIGNYKGGVGKTTTVINFANYLFEKDKKVLTIDLDPQSSLSEIQIEQLSKNSSESREKTLSELAPDECLNYVFDLSITKISKYPNITLDFSKCKLIHNIKLSPISNARYDFIPSSLFYRDGLGLDKFAILMQDNIAYLSILKTYIDTIKENYDYILIDCPPSNNLITQSAFLLSDYYLIPTILDKISTMGVVHYIKTVEKLYRNICTENEDAILARHYFGNAPKLIGVFFNLIRGQVKYDTEKRKIENALSEYQISANVFEALVNNYVDISRDAQEGLKSIKRDDFNKLCDEILTKLESDKND